MAKYRKKPVTIEAIQLGASPADLEAALDFCRGEVSVVHDADNLTHGLVIKTLEGSMMARVGDWIIRGVQGELYPCKPDIFAATYERAD